MKNILTPDEFYKLVPDFSYAPYGDMAARIMNAYRAACHYATWYEVDNDSGEWECSNCKVNWVFIDDGPEENGLNFCPKCGARIEAFIRDVE